MVAGHIFGTSYCYSKDQSRPVIILNCCQGPVRVRARRHPPARVRHAGARLLRLGLGRRGGGGAGEEHGGVPAEGVGRRQLVARRRAALRPAQPHQRQSVRGESSFHWIPDAATIRIQDDYYLLL